MNKTTLVAIVVTLITIALVVLTSIAIITHLLFSKSVIIGWIFILSTILTLTIVGYFLRFWLAIELPKKWQELAKKGKFITLPKEKHWIPVVKAGRFDRGYNCLAGVVTIQKAKLDRKDSEHYLIEMKDEKVFPDSLDLWLHRYFHNQGYIYLGLDAGENSTTKVDTLNIPKARITDTPGLDNVTITTEPIDALRLTFIRNVRVDDIELLDGYKASILCMATITVIDAYLAWYGLGGKAYDALDTYIARLVRSNAEEVTLRSMYTKGPDNGQNIIEQAVKNGDPAMPETIGMSATITIEGWDDNAPANFLELMGMVQKIEQQTLVELADLEKARQTALKQGDVYDAEAQAEIRRAELEVQKALTNKKEFKALQALAGKDEEALTHLILHKQLGDAYTKYLHARSIEKTNIKVMGEGALGIVKDI